MKNRFVLAVLVAVLATLSVACPKKKDKPIPSSTPAALEVTINTTCELASVPSLYTGAVVKLTYGGPCDYVTADFGGTDLFGVATKQINKEETVELTVLSASGSHYVWTLNCSCDPTGGHTTPEIKVGDPPPTP